MNRIMYFYSLLLCFSISTTYMYSYDKKDLDDYFRMRREKHREYLAKYPSTTEDKRYWLFLKETYPTQDTKTMFSHDIVDAIKVFGTAWENNTIWEKLVACDWDILYPSQSTETPLSSTITQKTAIAAISSAIGLPLIIGVCYKLARYAQQQYRKQQVTKQDNSADILQ